MQNQTSVQQKFPQQSGPGACASGTGFHIRPGMDCPRCGLGKLDYNGLLELECPHCGYRINSGTYT